MNKISWLHHLSFARIIIDHTDEEAQILNNYGVDDLKFLIKNFEVLLLSANADINKIMTEFNDWKFAIQNEAYRNISSISFWPSLYSSRILTTVHLPTGDFHYHCYNC